ncbi:hypothetical protein [Spiroplasma endosymbiont of Aspidapion aeneum]|uniref:hypothetical protein n=1 Tax=Spiroplasma endosymbiont of Aspidapion aeneum TaxID=3066276 RepID=UPI00313DEF2B
MSTNADNTSFSGSKIFKKGSVWFVDFPGTQKFIEYLDNKLLHEYVIWQQVGQNKSLLRTMDTRLKKVNVSKLYSNKKVNSLVVKAHDAYKELIIEMNWDEEISFLQAMKSTRFGYFYYKQFQKKFRPWFSAEEHEAYFCGRQNLNKDYSNSIFGKHWMNIIDRKNVINFLNLSGENKKEDYVKFFNEQILEIKNDLKKQNEKFFPNLDRQILNRTTYKKLGISIEMLNKPVFFDIELITSRIFKKYYTPEFHKKLFIFKIYDFIWNIYFCIQNLIKNVIESEHEKIQYIEDNIEIIGRVVVNYFIKSIGDIIYYLKEFRKESEIKSLKEFVYNLELLDNEYLQKIGKILCNTLELWLAKKTSK